jgi:hypothetical protein
MEHLIIPAIMCIVALGARFAMLDGNVLGWLGKIVERLPSNYLRKPLGTCERCMVSTWGTAALVILHLVPAWYVLPVYWLAATGLQEMLDR